MTVHGVDVMEDKHTELNFTLVPVDIETAGSFPVHVSSTPSTHSGPNITSTTKSPNSAQTEGIPSDGHKNSPNLIQPEHQAIQPQEFRHHNYADMELFLRKYSNEFPSIAHLYSIGRSVEDRELYVMVISDNPTVHEHSKSVV